MKVWVLSKADSWDRNEILGVFATIEVAKTIGEAEEPDRKFNWREDLGNWIALDFGSTGPIYTYVIEEFEVREK